MTKKRIVILDTCASKNTTKGKEYKNVCGSICVYSPTQVGALIYYAMYINKKISAHRPQTGKGK